MYTQIYIYIYREREREREGEGEGGKLVSYLAANLASGYGRHVDLPLR
jgi:hypothetical protein